MEPTSTPTLPPPPTTSSPTLLPPLPISTPISTANNSSEPMDTPQPTAKTTTPKTPPHRSVKPNMDKKKEKKTSRAGAANYSDEDVQALLDIAEDVEPLGANNWSEVASRFGKWAELNLRPARDYESLRNKFDKLANAKKKTGDPSCPPSVRRAKQISRAIQAKCAAYTLNESDEEDITSSTGALVAEENESSIMDDDCSSIVGARKRKRNTGATGTPSKTKKAEEVLLEHVGTMTEHIGSISKVLLTGAVGDSDPNKLKKEDVVEIVKREVRNNMRPTNEMLEKMIDIMRAKDVGENA